MSSPAGAAGEPDVLDTAGAGGAAIRGGSLRVAGYALGVMLSVLSAAVLFRHLGIADGGRYVTVNTLVAVVAGVTDAGLVAVGVRELSVRRGAARRRLLASLLGLRLVLTLLGVAGVLAFAALAGYPEVLVLGTLLAGAGLLLQVVQATLTIPLLSALRLGWVTALDLARQVALVAGIVALAALGASLLPFLALAVPVGAVVLVLTALALRGEERARPAFDRAEWVALLRDTLPFAAAVAIAAIYFRLALVLMSLVADPVETGLFALSFRVVDVLVVLPQLAVGAAQPIFARAARDDRLRLRYASTRTFEASLVLGAGLALALALGAPVAMAVLAGEQGAPAAGILRIQAAGLAASFVTAAFSYVLLSLRMHRALLAVSLVGLLVTAGGTLALVPVAGAEGAAAATALA
ncbi:MAG: hypothetical protein M3P39_08105, partial [Actinomycetota bacterium]|nr:hypothetical protein [Actinomycetota bacterium]